MNKFQKIACQIAKDDSKKELYKGQSIKKRSRLCYSAWNNNKKSWTFEKCLDFKNWSKTKKW